MSCALHLQLWLLWLEDVTVVTPPGDAVPQSQVDNPAAALVGEDMELVEQLRKVSLPQERCSGTSRDSWDRPELCRVRVSWVGLAGVGASGFTGR